MITDNHDEYLAEHAMQEQPEPYPIGTEVGVLGQSWSSQFECWQYDSIRYTGVVIGYDVTWVDDGTPESGPSEPYETEAVVIRSDVDGAHLAVPYEFITSERCPECGAFVTNRTVSTGVELSELRECSKGCGWADLAG